MNAVLRDEIRQFLNFYPDQHPPSFNTYETVEEKGYQRLLIGYPSIEGDEIRAYLLLPSRAGPFPAVLVHHQHNSERHLGKSEVCGLAGDPLQAIGPVLAQCGILVLAPDSICFEDRRRTASGIDPHPADTLQHFNEMCYRLTKGDTLMHKVLEDATTALSLLIGHPQVDSNRIGVYGHSYGGNTVLFQAALDERIQFACSSGAACSYQYKFTHEVGLEMALVIPGFAARYDFHQLVSCIAPRRLLIVSATEDPFSHDADQIVTQAQSAFPNSALLQHYRYTGTHALTQARFDAIFAWFIEQMPTPPQDTEKHL